MADNPRRPRGAAAAVARTGSVLGWLVLLVACASPPAPPVAPEESTERLQALLDRAVAEHAEVPGVALHVDSPRLGLAWEGAAGMADPATGRAMTPVTPVRIASNTKTFVAAAVLRLSEQGRLGLGDPIARHLSRDHLDLLRADGYDTEAMTVRHLLTHTSGLFDHTEPDDYGARIVADPQHRWTRDEQLRLALEWGDPHGPPGRIYTYCDTGYVLLGEVVERASGKPLPEAVRELVDYDGLGLDSTWWESLEPPPRGVVERAHQFLGELDTATFDPSCDLYGGGGLVSTVGDMARLFRALFTGGVYRDENTTAVMLTTLEGLQARPDATESALPPGAYRMGVWVVEIDGRTTYRHTGFWGTGATYVPELDLTVTATVNQNGARPVLDGLLRDAIAVASELDVD